jgi:hypothetical protein
MRPTCLAWASGARVGGMSRDLAAGQRITVRLRGTGQYTEEGYKLTYWEGKIVERCGLRRSGGGRPVWETSINIIGTGRELNKVTLTTAARSYRSCAASSPEAAGCAQGSRSASRSTFAIRNVRAPRYAHRVRLPRLRVPMDTTLDSPAGACKFADAGGAEGYVGA